MEIEEFIEKMESTPVSERIVEEMELYDERPELLKEGVMIPNFQNMQDNDASAVYHFYVGMIYGVGIANKHDIDGKNL